MRILVIGNSIHHGKTVLFLIREILALDPTVQATLVCYASVCPKFAEVVGDAPIEIVTFEGTPLPSADRTTEGFDDSVSRTSFLRSMLKFKRSVASLSASPVLGPVLTAMRETTPGHVLRERALTARLRVEKQLAEAVFDRVRPDVVVAFGDRHPDLEAPLLRVARDRGIKVLLPYTSYSGKDILVEVRKSDGMYTATGRSLYRRAKAKRYRDQVHEGLLYQSPHILAAYDQFGALSRYPWCLGNGLSDAVCVDSAATADRYHRDGVPREKLRIVGDVVYDKVVDVDRRREAIRAGLMERYGFDPSKRLIVVALPQLAEQGVLDWETHWKEMRFLVEALTRTGQNVLVSLHPRCKSEDYAFLEKEYWCRIAQERLAEFVSAPDVFVANYSSTVIWAILCGVRVVVVDFYGLNYTFFDYLRSVVSIRDRAKLDAALQQAVHGPAPDFSEDWRALSRDRVFDGRTIQRYLDVLREIS